MEIKELALFSNHIVEQEAFYKDVLGFNCSRTSESSLEISTKENKLILTDSDKRSYYHFAFLIAPESLESAIEYVENRSIELLVYKDSKIIHFDSGRAIYFYDMDGNIVEFIERPTLGYPPNKKFSMDDVIKLNEIGLPVKRPLEMAKRLVREFHIHPLDESGFKDSFCWVGDLNGVIIVVKEGRNWLPTQKPGMPNDFSITYADNGVLRTISFENNTILF